MTRFLCLISIFFVSCSNIKDSKLFVSTGDVERFIDRGGDPNTRFALFGNPKQEMTFLHFAVMEKDSALIKKLIAVGADPNALNSAGQTPLMTVFSEFREIGDMVDIIDILAPITALDIKDNLGEDVFDIIKMYWGDKWTVYLQKYD
jgi:ankyrin repeat protein